VSVQKNSRSSLLHLPYNHDSRAYSLFPLNSAAGHRLCTKDGPITQRVASSAWTSQRHTAHGARSRHEHEYTSEAVETLETLRWERVRLGLDLTSALRQPAVGVLVRTCFHWIIKVDALSHDANIPLLRWSLLNKASDTKHFPFPSLSLPPSLFSSRHRHASCRGQGRRSRTECLPRTTS